MGILHPEGLGQQKAPAEVGLLLVRSSRGNISLNTHSFGLDTMGTHSCLQGKHHFTFSKLQWPFNGKPPFNV